MCCGSSTAQSNLYRLFHSVITMIMPIFRDYYWAHFMGDSVEALKSTQSEPQGQRGTRAVWLRCRLLWHCAIPTRCCRREAQGSSTAVRQGGWAEGKGCGDWDLFPPTVRKAVGHEIKELVLDLISDWWYSRSRAGVQHAPEGSTLPPCCHDLYTSPLGVRANTDPLTHSQTLGSSNVLTGLRWRYPFKII